MLFYDDFARGVALAAYIDSLRRICNADALEVVELYGRVVVGYNSLDTGLEGVEGKEYDSLDKELVVLCRSRGSGSGVVVVEDTDCATRRE